MSATWRIEDDPARRREDELLPARGTVSIAFVRGTLLRLWYVWVGSTLLGAALAFSWLALVPPTSVGVVSLLLAHDPSTDQDTAMATDVTLLKTRTVAQQLAEELGLEVSPDDLQRTIVAEAATSSVLRIEILGSSQDDAVRRVRELAQTYLAFRQEQLTKQSEDLTQGYRDRVEALQIQVDGLTRQYDAITARGGSEQETAEVLGQRGLLTDQIIRLQNQIETQRIESDAVILASRVLDEAALVPQSPLRRAGLAVGSGLVGGLGLGLALVVVYAITTGRLRSRADVATAMGVPVMYSAGNIVTRRRPFGPAHRSSLDLLVDGLEAALPPRGKRSRRLGLVTVDCEQEGAMVLAGLARRLGAEGSVLAVDLAGTGLLERELEGPPVGLAPRGAQDRPHPPDPGPHERAEASGPRERPPSPAPGPQSALTRPCRGDSAYGADPNLAQRLGPERRRPQGTRLGVEHLDTGQYVESGWKYLDHLAHALDVVRGLD